MNTHGLIQIEKQCIALDTAFVRMLDLLKMLEKPTYLFSRSNLYAVSYFP